MIICVYYHALYKGVINIIPLAFHSQMHGIFHSQRRRRAATRSSVKFCLGNSHTWRLADPLRLEFSMEYMDLPRGKLT
jgi:hypothetical protein